MSSAVLPARLSRALATTRKRLRPTPLNFNVVIKPKAPTFSLEYLTWTITVPPFWKEFKSKHLYSFIGHEHKHGSSDGLPFTFVNRKKHQASCMAQLGLSEHEAGRLLNCVYDACINRRLFEQGFLMKEAQQIWADRFPVTKGEGGEYHLLQIIFKQLLQIKLPKTDYEDWATGQSEFRELLEVIGTLIRQQDAMRQEKDVDTVLRVVHLFKGLVRHTHSDDGPLCQLGDEPVPAELMGEVAEAASDVGLDAKQLRDLLNDPGVTDEDAEKVLREAEEGKAKTRLWHSLIAFQALEGSGGRTIQEPHLARWRSHSISKLDPMSVALNPYTPSSWRERQDRPFATIPQQSDDSGFEELIVVLDLSGSTKAIYGGKQVIAFEKESVYSALGFSRKQGLPASVVTFEDVANVVARRESDQLKLARLVSRIPPIDSHGSELGAAIQCCIAMHPQKALVVIITDGAVSVGDTEPLLRMSDANEVVCVVVTPSVTDNVLLKAFGGRLTTFQVKPDSAGHALTSQLGLRMRRKV